MCTFVLSCTISMQKMSPMSTCCRTHTGHLFSQAIALSCPTADPDSYGLVEWGPLLWRGRQGSIVCRLDQCAGACSETRLAGLIPCPLLFPALPWDTTSGPGGPRFDREHHASAVPEPVHLPPKSARTGEAGDGLRLWQRSGYVAQVCGEARPSTDGAGEWAYPA